MATPENLETGKAVLEQMSAQSDLLLTLAMAVIGGTIALLIQIRFGTSGAGSRDVKWAGGILTGILCQFASILFAYLTVGALVIEVPTIMFADYAGKAFEEAGLFGFGDPVRFLPILQFGFFLVGIGLVTAGFWRNLK